MKLSKLCWVLVVLVCTSASAVFAQFELPSKDPYSHSLPAVINAGNTPQIKKGGAGVLGIRLVPNSMGDMDWLAQFTKSASLPAVVTDSAVSIFRHSILGVDPNWVLNTTLFGLDTNAPISVNGLWSKGAIYTAESVETQSLGFEGIKSAGKSLPQAPLCIKPDTGSLVVCAGVSTPIITLTVSPHTVSAQTPTFVTLNWSTSNASECHALSGAGFYTEKSTSGTDESNQIDKPKGATERFTIACTNDMGVVTFKSVDVSVQ